jgi:hypothetical protein
LHRPLTADQARTWTAGAAITSGPRVINFEADGSVLYTAQDLETQARIVLMSRGDPETANMRFWNSSWPRFGGNLDRNAHDLFDLYRPVGQRLRQVEQKNPVLQLLMSTTTKLLDDAELPRPVR